MSSNFTTSLEQFIADVYALHGVRLVWKDANAGLRMSQPRSVSVHQHPGCLAVKQQRYKQCFAWCGVPGRRASGRGQCHAGFVQWRWPIHDEIGLMGFACLGPFSTHDPAVPRPLAAKQLVALERVIRLTIEGLAPLRQRELGRLAFTPQHPSLLALVDHLHQAPRHSQRAADLAALVRVSPSRLQHIVREEMGMSLQELCDRHLLNHARRMLLDPHMLPVQQVAHALDFRDQRAFATWFRRHQGCSPTQWRRLAEV